MAIKRGGFKSFEAVFKITKCEIYAYVSKLSSHQRNKQRMKGHVRHRNTHEQTKAQRGGHRQQVEEHDEKNNVNKT